MQKPEVIRENLLDMQVCVPGDWSDKQVEDFANKERFCGTTSGWRVRKEGNERLGGYPERNPCSNGNGYVHVTLEA